MKTPRSGFGETTFGNCITFTIDGQQNFRLIYEKIKEAKKSIYILNYDLDPALHLIRGEGNAIQSFRITDLVASRCKSESLSSIGSEQDSNSNGSSSYDNLHSDSKNNNKKYRQYFHNYTLQNLLIQKANQKVDIKIIVWEPRSIIRKLPGIKKRGLEGREKKVQVIKEAAKHAGVENYITICLDSKAPVLTSGFHEKIIIIDNEIGFCGGQDLSQDKWDTSDHDFDSPLRDSGGDPWHDVQVMVKGPILWDLIYHFNQRWVYSIWKDIRQVKKIVKASSVGSYLSSISSFILSPDLFADKGDVEITALRTWKQLSEEDNNDASDNKNTHHGSEGSNSIQSWYDAMFRKAKHSIYIEDQFLFQDKAITRILVNRLKEEKNLKMITVGPMEPNLPGLIFSVLSKESINDINNNLAALRKVGEDRVRTYSLISQHDRLKQRRKQIYVHSKLMIVDDKWITIGSANTDRDGFKDSTEFDLGIVSTTVAQELRVKLWREHLKTDDAVDYSSSSPQPSRYNDNAANLYNFEEGFESWEKLAEDNGKRVRTHESIRGHVYYYNFQEMNYPPPYQQAKGGNKFRLF